MPKGRPKCPYRAIAKFARLPRYFDRNGVERLTASGNRVAGRREQQFAADNRANVKRWRKENPEKRLAQGRRRRAGMSGHVTPEQIELLRIKQDGQCFYCAGPLEPETFDHFIPISIGGEHSIDNGRLACNVCNARKRDLQPREFFIKIWNNI